MAVINMCDRCGNMGLGSAIGTLIFHTGPHAQTNKLELCPECVGELVEFVKTHPERDSRIAFREEWKEVKELETKTGE